MKKHLLLFVGLLCWSLGQAQQTLDLTMNYGGRTRQYLLYIPAIYDGSEPVPFLFNLHGYTSNNGQQNFYGDFKPIADTANFIMCLPNGTADANGDLYWNAGFGTAVDDSGFLMALLDVVNSQYNIDPARIYSTGMSNGGYMSHTLACEHADKIAAIASVTGGMTLLQANNCNPTRPVPTLQIHGTADATVPYLGGANTIAVETLVANWTVRNGCAGAADTIAIPNTNTTDNCTATRYDFGSCAAGNAVSLIKVTGGTHTWPGAIINLGVTNMDFSASLAAWQFMSCVRHPNSVLSAPQLNRTEGMRVYPNPVADMLQLNTAEGGEMFISNLNGQVLHTQVVQAGAQSIDVSNLATGFYTLTLHNASGVYTQKLMKF